MSTTTTAASLSNAAPLRITRRGRLALSALTALPVLAASLLLATPGAQAGAEAGEAEVYSVLSGESMWDIAEQLAPNTDPRIVIDQLVRTNNLDSTAVHPGQQLVVPSAFAG